MENFYQESGRAGRDGTHAECILMYRLPDIFRITTMMFSEYTGLKNAYAMIDYCINGSKCRRDLISKHFSDVWNESTCGKMCDHCFYIDRPKGPKMDIANDCKSLRKIIRRADDLKMNLTALKLVEAWYGKGPSTLRIEAVPKYDRYYAEQIIAYLIINDYLKEEFSFTPYATYSYIKQGPEIIPANGIQFQCARIYNLPKPDAFPKRPSLEKNHSRIENSFDGSDEEEVVFVSSSTKKNRKRIVVSDVEDESDSDTAPPIISKAKRITKNSFNETIELRELEDEESKFIEVKENIYGFIDLDDDSNSIHT